jgi:hypothetical protein
MPVADGDYKKKLERKRRLVNKRSGFTPKNNPSASEGPSVNANRKESYNQAPVFRDRTRIMPSQGGGLTNTTLDEDAFIEDVKQSNAGIGMASSWINSGVADAVGGFVQDLGINFAKGVTKNSVSLLDKLGVPKKTRILGAELGTDNLIASQADAFTLGGRIRPKEEFIDTINSELEEYSGKEAATDFLDGFANVIAGPTGVAALSKYTFGPLGAAAKNTIKNAVDNIPSAVPDFAVPGGGAIKSAGADFAGAFKPSWTAMAANATDGVRGNNYTTSDRSIFDRVRSGEVGKESEEFPGVYEVEEAGNITLYDTNIYKTNPSNGVIKDADGQLAGYAEVSGRSVSPRIWEDITGRTLDPEYHRAFEEAGELISLPKPASKKAAVQQQKMIKRYAQQQGEVYKHGSDIRVVDTETGQIKVLNPENAVLKRSDIMSTARGAGRNISGLFKSPRPEFNNISYNEFFEMYGVKPPEIRVSEVTDDSVEQMQVVWTADNGSAASRESGGVLSPEKTPNRDHVYGKTGHAHIDIRDAGQIYRQTHTAEGTLKPGVTRQDVTDMLEDFARQREIELEYVLDPNHFTFLNPEINKNVKRSRHPVSILDEAHLEGHPETIARVSQIVDNAPTRLNDPAYIAATESYDKMVTAPYRTWLAFSQKKATAKISDQDVSVLIRAFGKTDAEKIKTWKDAQDLALERYNMAFAEWEKIGV